MIFVVLKYCIGFWVRKAKSLNLMEMFFVIVYTVKNSYSFTLQANVNYECCEHLNFMQYIGCHYRYFMKCCLHVIYLAIVCTTLHMYKFYLNSFHAIYVYIYMSIYYRVYLREHL